MRLIYPTLAYFIKNKQNEHPITMEGFEEYMDSKQWFALIHLICTPSLPRTLYVHVWSMTLINVYFMVMLYLGLELFKIFFQKLHKKFQQKTKIKTFVLIREISL